MAPESQHASAAPVPSQEGPSPRAKYRVRFRKAGDLRLVSHHDLMHIFERTFRRADLSVPTTQGFNPRPRMWFALSLALGVAGLNEVLELELTEALPAEEVERRLTKHLPLGLDVLSVRAIDVRTSARVQRAWLRLPLVEHSLRECGLSIEHVLRDCGERCQAFLAQSACWFERIKPQRRRINLRTFVSALHLADDGLTMALWISPTGSARPEEVLAVLGLSPVLEAGAVLERTDLEIVDELPPGTPLSAPDLSNAIEASVTNDLDAPAEAATSARPTAIISNPMSFDS